MSHQIYIENRKELHIFDFSAITVEEKYVPWSYFLKIFSKLAYNELT